MRIMVNKMNGYTTELIINAEPYWFHFSDYSLDSEGCFDMNEVFYSENEQEPIENWKPVAGSEIEDALEADLYSGEEISYYQGIVDAMVGDHDHDFGLYGDFA